MNKNVKSLISIALAAAAATALCACSTEQPESAFDSPLPWIGASTVEKLDYSVAVYDTSNGDTADTRVKIGDGTLTCTLEVTAEPGYSALDTSFSVTYINDEKAGNDRGLTDTIVSRVVFEPKSLAAKSMTKTVELAPRPDEKENRSYTISADYFGTHEATFRYTKKQGASELKQSLPHDACHDNEMMIYLARAQSIGAESSTNFKIVNLFDTFNTGELVTYTMAVSGGGELGVEVDDFVKDFGVEATTDESGKSVYSVECIKTLLVINAEKRGPGYTAVYAKTPFTYGGYEYKKVPIRMEYSTFNGSSQIRRTEYNLSGCSFGA